jgi:1-phosphofructokinase family hexose kinase
MIVTVTLNPSVDRTVFVNGVNLNDSNRIIRAETDAGGKGVNVARIVKAMGAKTVALGFVAGGPGQFVRHVLDHEGVAHDFIEVQGETRLNVSIEDGTGKPPTTLNERGPTISEDDWSSFLNRLHNWLPLAEWVEIGGSVPPGLATSVYADLVRIVHKAGKKVCLDADGEAMMAGLSETPNMIKPNREEVQRLLGFTISNLEQALSASKLLLAKGVEFPFVSMGSLGAALAASNGGFLARPPEILAKSTIGSGDSLIGAFLASLLNGRATEEALKWGVAAGAATALSDGASIGTRGDIDRLFELVQMSSF